jgi:hypothetical protein
MTPGYDNDSIFVVSYAHGASGSFLACLLERVFFDALPFRPYETDENNCAHLTHQFANYKESESRTPGVDRFDLLQLTNPLAPAFLPVHSFRPKQYRSRFPKCKIVTIIHREEDALELSLNGLFKHTLDKNRILKRPDLHGRILPAFWFERHTCPPLVEDIKNTHALSFTGEQKRRLALMFKPDTLVPGLHLLKDDPAEYGENIWFVNYRDIQDNPATVIATLEDMTGKKANESAWTAIHYYANKQKEFISRVKKELDL